MKYFSVPDISGRNCFIDMCEWPEIEERYPLYNVMCMALYSVLECIDKIVDQ